MGLHHTLDTWIGLVVELFLNSLENVCPNELPGIQNVL